MDIASLADSLRDAKAVTFVADVEGEAKTLAFTRTKGCWERLARLAVSVGADSVECRDKAGGVVAVVRVREEAPKEAAQPVAMAHGSTSEVAALLSLVVASADKQVSRYASSVEQVLSASMRMLDAVTRRMEALDERHRAQEEAREAALRADAQAVAEAAAEVRDERARVEAAIEGIQKAAEEDGQLEMVTKLLAPFAETLAAKAAAKMV